MLYAVRVTLSNGEWNEAIRACADQINGFNDVDRQPASKLFEIYRTVMKMALKPHHDWLEAGGITAVITAAETEGSFIFYFDEEAPARAFRERFAGSAQPGAAGSGSSV